jgi:hypothetical protein
VQRIRAKQQTAAGIGTSTATTSERTRQSKKRKRGNEEQTSELGIDELAKQLAEERRLRRIAEGENYFLCQRLEKCEEQLAWTRALLEEQIEEESN